jgi:taurine transport system substrate-binding protein
MICWTRCAALLGVALCAAAYAEEITPIRVGYLNYAGPWKYAIADGHYEQEVGRDFQYFPIATGARALRYLEEGQLDISEVGSPPFVQSVSRQVDSEMVYVNTWLTKGEGLIVQDSANIQSPRDLIGKTVGVSYGSTSHFSLEYVFELFQIARSQGQCSRGVLPSLVHSLTAWPPSCPSLPLPRQSTWST